MAQFVVAGQVRNPNIQAANAQAATAAFTAALTPVLPVGYTLANVVVEAPVFEVGDWVVAKRPGPGQGQAENEAYALVVVGTGGPTAPRQVEFGDGLRRGLDAIVRKAP